MFFRDGTTRKGGCRRTGLEKTKTRETRAIQKNKKASRQALVSACHAMPCHVISIIMDTGLDIYNSGTWKRWSGLDSPKSPCPCTCPCRNRPPTGYGRSPPCRRSPAPFCHLHATVSNAEMPSLNNYQKLQRVLREIRKGDGYKKGLTVSGLYDASSAICNSIQSDYSQIKQRVPICLRSPGSHM